MLVSENISLPILVDCGILAISPERHYHDYYILSKVFITAK
jgi:hypothetical protein